MFSCRRATLVTVDLQSATEVATAWRSCITRDEAARIDRFRRPEDRISNAAAHCLKRLLLARATGMAGVLVDIVAAPSGKPVLRDQPDLHFNISHTDGMAAVAISAGLRIGVDVEALGRHKVDGELAEAALGRAASIALWALPSRRRELCLHSAWTAREAVTKADGRALAISTRQLKLRGNIGEVLAPGGRRWCIFRPDVGRRHVAALATPAPILIHHRHIDANDLVRWAKLTTF